MNDLVEFGKESGEVPNGFSSTTRAPRASPWAERLGQLPERRRGDGEIVDPLRVLPVDGRACFTTSSRLRGGRCRTRRPRTAPLGERLPRRPLRRRAELVSASVSVPRKSSWARLPRPLPTSRQSLGSSPSVTGCRTRGGPGGWTGRRWRRRARRRSAPGESWPDRSCPDRSCPVRGCAVEQECRCGHDPKLAWLPWPRHRPGGRGSGVSADQAADAVRDRDRHRRPAGTGVSPNAARDGR